MAKVVRRGEEVLKVSPPLPPPPPENFNHTPRSSVTWIGPIVSSWAIGDLQIVNHDEEGAEICSALRFSWFSYNDVMQNMVHKANQQVINGIHSRASLSPVNLNGALRNPNGRILSK